MSKRSVVLVSDKLKMDLRSENDLRINAIKKIIKVLIQLKERTPQEIESEDVQEFLNRNTSLESLAPDLAHCALDPDPKIFQEACEALNLIVETGANVDAAVFELAQRAVEGGKHGELLRTMLMVWAEKSRRIAQHILKAIDANGIRVDLDSVWYRLYPILGFDTTGVTQKLNMVESHFDVWDKLFGQGKKDCEICSKIPEVTDESQSGETEAPTGEFAKIVNGLYRVVEGIKNLGQVGDIEIRGCSKCGQLYEDYSESHDLAGFHSSRQTLSKRAFEELRDFIRAMARTGEEYKLSSFVDKLRQTAEAGNEDSQMKLARALMEGKGLKKDQPEAFKWVVRMAKTGKAYTEANLGLCYLQGWGVEKNYEEALKWLRNAADKGYEDAQYNLGYMYDEGLGVERNEEQAIIWFRKAADQGFEMAIKTMSMKTYKFRCPNCSSTNVEEGGIFEFTIYQCKDCGFRQTVSIIYPEADWTNKG